MNFRSTENVRADDNVREERLPFILSQYSASARIISILNSVKENLIPDVDIALLYDDMINVETAQGSGLDAWGRIVGVERNIPNYDKTALITLTDDDFRSLIMYKALANITESTFSSLNTLLHTLYPNLSCYVQQACEYKQDINGNYYDSNVMQIRWYFDKDLSGTEKAIFNYAGTVCRGAGVGFNLIAVTASTVFGFNGSGLQPFNQGTFYNV